MRADPDRPCRMYIPGVSILGIGTGADGDILL
jgi:hypothetical protein